jgi:class 3 adenylate cyclase
MAVLPVGTVTFAFTDVEGSTQLLKELGDRYADVVRDYRRIVREALAAAGGNEVDTQGDAFFFSFPRARDAVAGAVAAQRALAAHDWPDRKEVRVRIGLHTGEPAVGEEGYVGLDVVRAARICAAAHGGQILLSETTRALLGGGLPDGTRLVDLGVQRLKDVEEERIYQLSVEGLDDRFPTLRSGAGVAEAEELGQAIARQVNAYVERSIAQSLSAPGSSLKLTAFGLVELLLVVAAVVAIVVLVRLVF